MLDREQRVPPRSLRLLQEFIGDLIYGVSQDSCSAVGTIRAANARPQQPEEVVQLSRCCNGRTRVPCRILLLDSDRRSNAKNLIDIRLLHSLQELARIGGKRLHI